MTNIPGPQGAPATRLVPARHPRAHVVVCSSVALLFLAHPANQRARYGAVGETRRNSIRRCEASLPSTWVWLPSESCLPTRGLLLCFV